MRVKIVIPKRPGKSTTVEVEGASGTECAGKLKDLLNAHGIRSAKAKDGGDREFVHVSQRQ